MGYISVINDLLTPKITEKAVVLDLFAGCGGMSLGFEAAGFKTIGIDLNPDAAITYKTNLKGDCIVEKLTLDSIYPTQIGRASCRERV